MLIEAGKFPNVTERERITTLRKFQKLYENEAYTVLGVHDFIKKQYTQAKDLVYLAHAIPARVSDFYGDFVQGDVNRLIIEPLNGTDEEIKFVDKVVDDNDIKEKIYDWGVDQSEFGFGSLLGRIDGKGNYIIEAVPQDQYFPQPDGSVIFATYKKDPSDKLTNKLLCLTQNYELENNKVKITRQAWTTDERGVVSDVYDFNALIKLLGKEDLAEEEIIELDELPIRQFDNGKRTRWGFGKSDYADILPNLAEVNERSTHISTTLLKNLDAKLAVSKNAYNAEGELLQKEVFKLEDKDDPRPEYILNSNPLVNETREHIIQECKFISWVTCVPMFELLKSAMPERVESLRIQLFSAVRRTDTKRSKLKKALSDMLNIGYKMKTKKDMTVAINIDFSDVLPIDELQDTEKEEIKTRSGLSSKRSAMKRLENYDDDEVDQELEEIKKENVILGIGEGGQAPTL